ncbi:MAG: hypothetical protein E7677_05290, partial [Ruminococcaceae bacterium]|nr:hypothetical protein [Oscillospiraceae bacterium]
FNAETWGEYSKNASERIYTYADFSPFNTSTNGGKTGTIDAPYEISTPEQLAGFAALVNAYNGESTVELTGINNSKATATNFFVNSESQHVKLMADIDLSGHDWLPIGTGEINAFKGVFDGAGYTISGLSIESSTVIYAGLFGYVTGGTVKNVGVSGEIKVTLSAGNAYVGGLVGYANAVTIENCYSTCNLNGSSINTYVGGLAGRVSYTTITNSYNTGSVSGTGHTNSTAGGLVGIVESATITNCYSACDVSGNVAGGCIGQVGSMATITDCYWYAGGSQKAIGEGTTNGSSMELMQDQIKGAAGKTDSSWEMIGILGNTGSLVDALNKWVESNTSYSPWHIHDGEYPTLGAKESVAYENGFCSICGGGCEKPTLNGDGFYEIDNAGKLYWFAAQVNSGNKEINGKLTNNIVVNQNVLNADGSLNGDGSNFRVWTPIGNSTNNYAGTFDGAGFTVSGLYYNDSAANHIAFIGYLYRIAIVKNVIIADSYLSGKNFVGGIVGVNNGTVSGCTNISTVNGAEMEVGGVVGENNATVSSCANSGTVSGKLYIGGVVGYNANMATVQNCYNTGNVSGTTNVGGVVGLNQKTVANCYNTGNVSGTTNVGGIVGINNGTIERCYYNSDVYTGDAVGSNGSQATVDTLSGGKTTVQFEIGEVTYYLNDGNTDGTQSFYQTVGTGIPAFSGDTVYRLEDCSGSIVYSNSKTLTSHTNGVVSERFFDSNGKCLVCGTQAEAKLVYITSGDADAESETELYINVESAMERIKDLVEGGISPEILHPEITLLTDLNDTLTISGDLPYFRIALNGYDIITPDDSALIVHEGADVSVVNLSQENESVIKTEASNTASIIVNGRLSLAGKTYMDTGANKLTVGGAMGIYLSENITSTGYCELVFVNFDNSGANVTFGNSKGTLHIDTDLTDTIYVDRGTKTTEKIDAVITVGSGLKTTENLDKIMVVNELDAESLVKTFKHEDIGDGSKLLRDSEIIIGELSVTQNETEFTYNGTSQTPSVIVTIKTDDDTHSLNDNKHYIHEFQDGETYTDAGLYDLKIVFSNDIRMNEEENPYLEYQNISWTINKATPTASDFTFTLPADLTYNGEAKAVTVTVMDGIVGMGEITVKYVDADFNPVNGLPTNQGVYDLEISVAEGKNYTAVNDLFLVSFNISPFTLGEGNIAMYPGEYTYSGSKQQPEITVVVDGKPLVIDKDYTVTWDKEGFVYAGTYTATIQGIGNYKGSVEKSYVINPKPLVDSDISIYSAEETYSGGAYSPTISVKDGDIWLSTGPYGDFDVTWDKDGFVDAGTYTATITGKNNYSGSFTRTFVIKQAELELEFSSPITSVLPGNQIALTLNTNSDATPLWTLDKATLVSGSIVKVDDGLVIGQDEVKITVTYPETTNVKGGSKTISLDVGMADFTGEIAELEADISELNKLIEENGEIDQINEKIADITNRIQGLEDIKDAYKDADTALKQQLEAIIETAKQEAVNAASTALENAKTELKDLIKAGDADNASELTAAVANLNNAISLAQDTAQKFATDADVILKGELEGKITEAQNALRTAVEKVAKDLADAEKKLAEAIASGDAANASELTAAVANLNNAISLAQDTAQKFATDADAILKGELEGKITEAQNTLRSAVEKVAKDLADAEKKLAEAIASGDAALDDKISAVSASLSAAKAALEKADANNKAALTSKIEATEVTLDAAIKAVQKNLDDAKATLEKALADGDKANAAALIQAISELNAAIDAAETAAATADGSLKSELTAKIDNADATLDAAIKAVQKDLDDLKADIEAKNNELAKVDAENKAALEANDAELQTFIIIVCAVSGVALCGSGAFVVWFFIDRKKKI